MKLTQLIEAIATETGTKHGTVKLKHRLMREAGLLTSGGRGRGGADMTSADLGASFFSEIAIGETTDIVSEVERMGNLIFSHAEWVNLSMLHDSFHSSIEGERPSLPYRHLGGPLPGILEDHQPMTAHKAVARLLDNSVRPASNIQIEYLSFESVPDGISVAIKYRDKLLPSAAMKSYIRGSGDSSDSMRFPVNPSAAPENWEFTVVFSHGARQSTNKEILIKLPGEVIEKIAREALRE